MANSDNLVPVEDTFAEAFPMSATRLLITARTPAWANIAATAITGYAASVIGCDCEAGIERNIPASETPDGRPGVAVLLFAFSRDALEKAVTNRVAQSVLTCATTAVYSGLVGDAGRSIKLGANLRYFGDGWQISKVLDGERYWRMPTMDGEFLCVDSLGTVKGVAGGNLIFAGMSADATLAAGEHAVSAMRTLPDVILPFPGGLVRSGSKVGSRYAKLKASTNEAYCPTLQSTTQSQLPQGTQGVYEIVIDGLTLSAVEAAMKLGLAVLREQPGLLLISAGNYGGKLGPHHIHLWPLLESNSSLRR